MATSIVQEVELQAPVVSREEMSDSVSISVDSDDRESEVDPVVREAYHSAEDYIQKSKNYYSKIKKDRRNLRCLSVSLITTTATAATLIVGGMIASVLLAFSGYLIATGVFCFAAILLIVLSVPELYFLRKKRKEADDAIKEYKKYFNSIGDIYSFVNAALFTKTASQVTVNSLKHAKRIKLEEKNEKEDHYYVAVACARASLNTSYEDLKLDNYDLEEVAKKYDRKYSCKLFSEGLAFIEDIMKDNSEFPEFIHDAKVNYIDLMHRSIESNFNLMEAI